MMSLLRLTVFHLILLIGVQEIFATSRQFSYLPIDRNANHWQRIQHMPCTHKLFQDDFQGIISCVLLSTYDAESFMVGMNETHCILCYYKVNNATLSSSTFQGTLQFEKGELP